MEITGDDEIENEILVNDIRGRKRWVWYICTVEHTQVAMPDTTPELGHDLYEIGRDEFRCRPATPEDPVFACPEIYARDVWMQSTIKQVYRMGKVPEGYAIIPMALKSEYVPPVTRQKPSEWVREHIGDGSTIDELEKQIYGIMSREELGLVINALLRKGEIYEQRNGKYFKTR